MYSLVIPVYMNEESIPELVKVMEQLNDDLDGELEVVFVVDGSPDRSAQLLRELLLQSRQASGDILEPYLELAGNLLGQIRSGLCQILD